MVPECCLIKSLYNKNNYNTYYNNINIEYIKTNNKELYTLYITLRLFHEKFTKKDIESTAELEVFFYSLYPALSHRERDVYEALFQSLDELNVDPELSETYLKALQERQEGHRLALLGLDIAEGRKSIVEAHSAFKDVLEAQQKESQDSPFISNSLLEIYEKRVKEPGLRWPLKTLNQMMGSLRKGDYGFVFARPETGKTTFIAHTATYMAQQLKETQGPILWFNNEQEGHVVLGYCYRAALGLTNEQLYANIEENEEKYETIIGAKLLIFDAAAIYRTNVDQLCQRCSPSLVIFDQIDKLRGFDNDRDELRLGTIYQWARELAKTYCPVIGVCQAGESGADKRWLTMEDVVNAKTSKQAEADWILGIGKLDNPGYEKVRHFHVCKNKLSGDSDTIPEMRHGKQDVLIYAEISRYKDIE